MQPQDDPLALAEAANYAASYAEPHPIVEAEEPIAIAAESAEPIDGEGVAE